MKLYINKDIAADAEKIHYWLQGDDAVSYTDISQFLAFMAEYAPDDNVIDIEIHSCGGDCVEGYAIYDALRASGKDIRCCVVGRCASMATVILLAAPKENRTMYEHAQLLIHEPYYPNIGGEGTITKLDSLKAKLEEEARKMLAVYSERTGTDEETLHAQMMAGDWFGAERAIELGFIGSVVPAISAHVEDETISTTKEDMEKEKSAIAKAFELLGKALGLTAEKEEEVTPVSMVVTDVNGTEININREEGLPQVGDETTAPDGEYVLENGTTLVIKEGVIVEIRPADEDVDAEEEKEEAQQEDAEKAALAERVAELEQELEALKAAAKTEDETAVLAFVAEHGGIEELRKKAVGSWTPPVRTSEADSNPAASDAEATIKSMVSALREKRAMKK